MTAMVTLRSKRARAPDRPEHIEDWLEEDPDQHLTAEEAELVEEARAFVRAQSFVPLVAEELHAAHVRTETAVGYAFDEGLRRSPLVAALCKLMIVEGAPSKVRGAVLEEFLPRMASLRPRAA